MRPGPYKKTHVPTTTKILEVARDSTMYQIPEAFDLGHLRGEILEQVVFSINCITLLFTSTKIFVWGGFTLICDGHETCKDEVYPVNTDYGILKLLEKTVVDIHSNDSRTDLYISFTNECHLILKGSSQYESYEIIVNDEPFIV